MYEVRLARMKIQVGKKIEEHRLYPSVCRLSVEKHVNQDRTHMLSVQMSLPRNGTASINDLNHHFDIQVQACTIFQLYVYTCCQVPDLWNLFIDAHV